MNKSSKVLWGGAAAVLFLALFFIVLAGAFRLEKQANEIEVLYADLAKAHSKAAEISSKLQRSNKENTNVQDTLSALRLEQMDMRKKMREQDVVISEYQRKLESALGKQFDAQNAPFFSPQDKRIPGHVPTQHVNGRKRVWFNYFYSDEWRGYIAETTGYIRGLGETVVRFGGKPGENKFSLRTAGAVVIADFRFISVEELDLRNGQKNSIFIMAPGLYNLEKNAFKLTVDRGMDRVFLDGCLDWQRQPADGNTSILFRAVDAEDKSVDVTIEGEVSVITEECDPGYVRRFRDLLKKDRIQSLRKTQSYLDAPTRKERRIHFKTLENTADAPQYAPDDAAHLKAYSAGVQNMPESILQEKIAPFLSLMKRGKLPTEFLSEVQNGAETRYTLKPLQLSAKDVSYYTLGPEFDCEKIGPVGKVGATSVLTGELSRILKCTSGSNIYFLTSEHADRPSTNLDIYEENGNDIYVLDKGDWNIIDRQGMDVVILRPGWGKLSFSKTCMPKPGNIIYRPEVMAKTFGGIGILFDMRDDGRLEIINTLPGHAAAAAGIRQGDIITMIDGQSIEAMSGARAIEALRGEVGTTVSLKYVRNMTTGYVEREAALVRQKIELPDDRPASVQYAPYQYNYPFEHTSFIVFAKGVKEEDMVWSPDGRVYRNSKTGDEISLGQHPCFGMLFEEEK